MPPSLTPSLLAGDRAPAPSTLAEIFSETVTDFPDALAIDNGREVLTYAELADRAQVLAEQLETADVGRGDKVGVRVSSGTTELYVAILGTLLAGAAYVPVDADDPDERARVVFGEAAVAVVVGDDLVLTPHEDGRGAHGDDDRAPTPADDAWVIFTSGSTGTPKGVAVTHRNAAAFVDAERRLFLQSEPVGPGDRVMAGLSVAFDASCEEMWLAWAYGACLVPAPRSLVRSGVDVGPWLEANDITVVSTVPTLVALWPLTALERVRLLIMGGEACPAELAARLQREGREVWNTYGPTEATVVACGALLDGSDPVRIGLPLDGWDLAVVDGDGNPVAAGEAGELIIGGVGLARYLDQELDAATYAPMPTLGWDRAYRSGDVVRNDPAGLVFGGRADDQVKLGGRRIELGEVDDQLLRLPGVVAAAAAVRSTSTGNTLLVGYLRTDDAFDAAASLDLLRDRLPAALVPRLAPVDDLPTRTSGKVDRDALPWPLPGSAGGTGLDDELEQWIAEIWQAVLGAQVSGGGDDFFDFGGGSLTAAQTVGRLRERFPEVAVGDLYAHPTVSGLAACLRELSGTVTRTDREVPPVPVKTQAGQLVALLPLRALAGLRWLAWLALGGRLARDLLDAAWAPALSWWLLAPAALVLLSAPGRMLLAAGVVRLVLRPVTPGRHPRGGKVHLRVWLAGRVQDELAAVSVAGAPYLLWYARLLGAEVGRDVDLHTLPPVTGLLRVGPGAAIEPEADLSGTWIDGDTFVVGGVRVRRGARVGARSTLAPGADVGREAEVAPGSLVLGEVPPGEYWSGVPASRVSRSARGPWDDRPSRGRGWTAAYAVAALVVAALPALGILAGLAVVVPSTLDETSPGAALLAALPLLPLGALVGYAVLALLVVLVVRLLGIRLAPGHVPVRSWRALRVWTTFRVLDDARTWLFPVYAAALTPAWLRLLGARIGTGVEASTVLLVPRLAQVDDHAFLADDTLLGCYELGGGWLRVDEVRIGKRAFLGNSGMAAVGRKVPKRSLVAVLSAAPQRGEAKKGSSWVGSPPTRLRRTAGETDSSRTYDPPTRLKVLRALVETARVVPLLVSVLWYAVTAAVLVVLLERHLWLAVVLCGPVLALAGALAAALSVLTKALLVGRHRSGEHPLWSSFVWRNELADTFTEVLAAPWFATVVPGTVALNVWLRALGARIGRGVWCETYWLPETDLVELGDGSVVNHGCVVQTHLFHDRVLALDPVRLRRGATLGPNSVVLPAATIGRHATIGPASLVMRGEEVPSRTRWLGNPIGPWEGPE
ncbi:putative non-ribosomal peptide synthase [Marmoricola endophyticus]|uniref:Non-ribosomal peptide synthase n=1 Tax=Marmoricola endophyticus TaxID=2040280 RepID=A0A917F653_9ACTN|nr:Pls/PosA family non-ribosomal peptide synthetase [Marmoricola endophyticus]GGF47530.1 putative non-ribosomal peptide synthase [Marmoricola endophyticus]